MKEQSLERESICGHQTYYEDTRHLRRGIAYLDDDLSCEEARVFFDQARDRGYAQFEDDDDREYTLLYEDSMYILVSRD